LSIQQAIMTAIMQAADERAVLTMYGDTSVAGDIPDNRIRKNWLTAFCHIGLQIADTFDRHFSR
jgi:RNA 3'-terminal phosphate cyclase